VRELKHTNRRVVTIWDESHPSRVRELKHEEGRGSAPSPLSHPSRVRELKLCGAPQVCAPYHRRTPPGCVN